ncbi:MAG: GNAT family N-acetyltransferase [Deltaproteobacteria bacterium]|nr:GNAT family N-acetyltransferase [Deltaproteobacteria bacterium]
MNESSAEQWNGKIISPEQVIQKIKPGMTIFIGTGVAEPRTLVRTLMNSTAGNLNDLELIQLISFGDAISMGNLRTQQFRLKTFFSGWVSQDAIMEGRVDLIPSRFAWIPDLIESSHFPVHAAFLQITPPDKHGNCSLGVAVDAARQAMEKATLVVGEINRQVPRTFGDTFVSVSEFTYLVEARDAPIYFDRWPVSTVYDQIADRIAELIEDRSCIAFSVGQLFEALGRHLVDKKHLGVHSPVFTDALMDLVKAGAVTNRSKGTYRGKSLASYAIGTPELFTWLDQNPLVEFQAIDKVFNPSQIGRNAQFTAVVAARKVDLLGHIALQIGKGTVATGPAEVADLVSGAEISPGGRTIFALPSRNRKGIANILISVKEFPNQFTSRESVDVVVTEYGIARLKGFTLRERAQALIDIAHPADRPLLVEQAKAAHIIYPDQIFLADSAHLYPAAVEEISRLRDGTAIRFRPIKPSDEEQMRQLFYRFSDETVYYRYFGHVKAMPHAKMQQYANVDWSNTMSIVGLVEDGDQSRVIAEARYIIERLQPFAEVVFVVDEAYQGQGIATYMYRMLVRLARERGVQGFTADVLFSNLGMMKVFRKGGLPVKAELKDGIYHLFIPFYDDRS